MFDNLKVGDEVVIKTFNHRCINAARVTRITKTQIILDGGSKYRKTDGISVGSEFNGYANRLSVEPIDLKKIALTKKANNIIAFANYLSKVSFCTENDVQKYLDGASEISKIIEKLKEHS